MVMSGSCLFKKLLVVEVKLLHLSNETAGDDVVALAGGDATNVKAAPLQSGLSAQSFSYNNMILKLAQVIFRKLMFTSLLIFNHINAQEILQPRQNNFLCVSRQVT